MMLPICMYLLSMLLLQPIVKKCQNELLLEKEKNSTS